MFICSTQFLFAFPNARFDWQIIYTSQLDGMVAWSLKTYFDISPLQCDFECTDRPNNVLSVCACLLCSAGCMVSFAPNSFVNLVDTSVLSAILLYIICLSYPISWNLLSTALLSALCVCVCVIRVFARDVPQVRVCLPVVFRVSILPVGKLFLGWLNIF